MKKKNLMGLTKKSLKPVKESVDNKDKKYKFTGIFTEMSWTDENGKYHQVINRNDRSYKEEVVLPHLGYLKKAIERDGGILGESDHPADRFEISVTNASHIIRDLWYDKSDHTIKGTIELLNNEKGNNIKEIVDAGYPLYVSSRAAGDVDEKTKEVEIAQIFTYDIVATPGFANARLERVNESKLSKGAIKFIKESLASNANAKRLHETELDFTPSKKPTIKYNINDLAKHVKINEGDDITSELEKIQKGELTYEDSSFSNGKGDKDDDDDKKKIKSVKVHSKDDDDDDDDDKGISDEEKEENRKKILSIEAEYADDEDEDDEDEDEEDEDEYEDDDEDEDEDDDKKKEDDDEESVDECDNDECGAKLKSIKKDVEEDKERVEKLLTHVKKSKEVKESIIEKYPFTQYLTRENFRTFTRLSRELREHCAEYVFESNHFNDAAWINEHFMDKPYFNDKVELQPWLKYATREQQELFMNESKEYQNNLRKYAQNFIFKTKSDVQNFWNDVNIEGRRDAKLMENAQMLAKKKYDSTEKKEIYEGCGYTQAYIDYITSLL